MLFKVKFFQDSGEKIYEYLFSSLKEAMVFNMAMIKKGFQSDIIRLDIKGNVVE